MASRGGLESRVPQDAFGLCGTCEHAKIVHSDRGSTFVRCMQSTIDPRFPKYPRVPVLACSGYCPLEECSDR
jgi:hypothetical protein